MKNYSQIRNRFTQMIIKSDNLTSHEKLIALLLKEHMNNQTGECYPSVATLMSEGAMSKPTVLKAIRGLEEKLYIKVSKRKYKNQWHNTYNFLINQGEVVNEVYF